MEENKAKIYSHSKLWLFENCPEAYKIKYIDKTFPDLPRSIEAFLGDKVHLALEWLYNSKMEGKQVSMDDVIEKFAQEWVNEFDTTVRIGYGKAEDYFHKGIRFLLDYYQKHMPFDEKTIETEKQILFDLDEEGKYKITGYVDRIVLNNGIYEVHDYKTNDVMKTQTQVDQDRQLALYHIGLQQIFGKDIEVKLIWHFLAHNKSISSTRTQEQLDLLRNGTIALIKKIEACTEWAPCGKRFCDWCSYKQTSGKTVQRNFPSRNMSLKKFF